MNILEEIRHGALTFEYSCIKTGKHIVPEETPSPGKLIIFAFQQLLVMFPATVTVALLTGF